MVNLDLEIEKKRQEMIIIGLNKGFHHKDTIRISEELDILINEMMQLKKGSH